MTDWREELIEKIVIEFRNREGKRPYILWGELAAEALAVAEPVIREQCANDALKRCFFCPADVAAAIRGEGA